MTNIGIQVGSLLTGTASFFTCSVLIRFLSSGRPACPPARLVCRVFFSVFVFVRPSSAFACSTHPAVDESVCCMHAVMLRCGLFSKRLRNRLGALRFRTCENCRLSKRTIEDSAPPRKHYMQQGMVHLSQRHNSKEHREWQAVNTNSSKRTKPHHHERTTTNNNNTPQTHSQSHTPPPHCKLKLQRNQTNTHSFLTLQQTKNKHSDNQLPKLQQTPTKQTHKLTNSTNSIKHSDRQQHNTLLSLFLFSLSLFLSSFFSFAKLHHSTPTANNKQLTHSLTHSRTHACTH